MDSLPLTFDQMTKVQWMGITILEPTTVLTNLVITIACLYAYFKLRKLHNASRVHKLFKFYFLIMGISTFVGGVVGHGFLYLTGEYGKIPGWFIGMAGVAFAERAAIAHAKPLMSPTLGKVLSKVNYIEIGTFLFLTFKTLHFKFVEIHALYALFVVVFSLELFVYIKRKDEGSRYIFYATALGAAAGLCHLLELGFNKWFNYNDVSHLFMTASIYCYYLATTKLKVYKQPYYKTRRSFVNPTTANRPATCSA